MHLQRCKIIVFLFIVREPSQDETVLFIWKFLAGVVIEHDDGPIMFSFEESGLLDEPQFFLRKLIDQALEVGPDVFFFIAEDEEVVPAFVPQVL
jgi:hypothetical protein